VNPFPVPSLQSFASDLTVIEVSGSYYFKASKGENLLITGYDFPVGWTKGFPYKSAATIDVFGQTAVPVVSLFQNFDYENQYFCKHVAQVVDENGIETKQAYVSDIVAYSESLTGDDLVEANEYYSVPIAVTTAVRYVSKAGSDAAAGTKADPWLTIQYAQNSSTNGDTIYVLSGEYAETYNGSINLRLIRSVTYNCIGKVVIKKAGTGGSVLYNESGSRTFNRAIIDAGGNTNSVGDTYSLGSARTTIYNNCIFKGGTASWLRTQLIETVNLNNCIAIGANAQTVTVGINSANNCLFVNHIDYYRKNNTMLNCNFTNYKMVFDTANTVNIKGCFVSNNLTFLTFNPNGASTASLTFNIFNLTGGTDVSLIDIQENGVNYVDAVLQNNRFYCNSDISGTINSLSRINTPKLIAENNHYSMLSASEVSCLISGSSIAIDELIKVKNNYFKSNAKNTLIVTIGGEGGSVYNKGAEFSGNRVIGFLYDTPSASGTQHATLFNSGGNQIIKHNYISHSTLGIVIKCGNGLAYTSGGCFNNLVEECYNAIWCRGVGGINIFNNTMRHSGYAYGSPFSRFIFADENPVQAGTQQSENVIIKNCIMSTPVNTGNVFLVGFDEYAGLNGCIVEDCQLDGGQFLLSDGTTAYSDLAIAQAAGKLLNCVVADPLLSAALIPLTPITGADLGEDYEDGLDVTTNWGGATTLPVIVTKQQGATWQKGAFIQ